MKNKPDGRKRKLNVSDERKEFIKKNYNALKNFSNQKLMGDERLYFARIEGGKKAAKRNVKYKGKYLGGELFEIVKKVADKKGLTPREYLNKNESAVDMLLESGFTSTSKRVDDIISIIQNQTRKTIEVEAPDGTVYKRVSKQKAVENLAMFQQLIASNTTVVEMGLNVSVFLNGKVRVQMPLISDADFEEADEESLTELLEESDAFFVKSDPAKKK